MPNKNRQFESLVKSFYKPLYRYAFWTCKNQQVAEDLVQETFARAWKNINQLKEQDSVKPWLFTILNRENARRFAKKQLPMVELTQEWNLEHIADRNNELDKVPLQRALLKLSDEYREPLTLQIVAGFTTDEIGEIMSLNSNTVSTRLFRARAELKTLMNSSAKLAGTKNG